MIFLNFNTITMHIIVLCNLQQYGQWLKWIITGGVTIDSRLVGFG